MYHWNTIIFVYCANSLFYNRIANRALFHFCLVFFLPKALSPQWKMRSVCAPILLIWNGSYFSLNENDTNRIENT